MTNNAVGTSRRPAMAGLWPAGNHASLHYTIIIFTRRATRCRGRFEVQC